MDVVERVLSEDDSFLPEFEEDVLQRKSISKSTELRNRGSQLFNQKNREESVHRMILSYYSKSIAYAPTDSEELALAYNNRSLLWLHLQKHDFCFIDIERALKITKSNDLREKLLTHKILCLDLSQSCKSKDHVQSDIPKTVPSKNIPCGTHCICLEHNEKYGKHFVATQDLGAGEIILCEQTSYAHTDIHNFYLVCSYCLTYAWTGIPCDTCVFAIYCSESCKKEAWSQYHDIMCPMLPILICRVNTDVCFFLSILRILIIAIKREGLETVISEFKKIDEKNDEENQFIPDCILDCKKFSTLFNLKSNFDEACADKGLLKIGVNHHVSVLLELLMESPIMTSNPCQKFSKNIILSSLKTILEKLFGIYSTNNFKFEDVSQAHKNSGSTYYSDRGNILALCSSFINHSCDPNTFRIFLPGPKIVMFTSRPVKKGEQLCNSYGVDVTIAKDVRQRQLREAFSFWCECKPCIENWSDSDDMLQTIDPLKMMMLGSKILNTFSGKHDIMRSQPPVTWPCSQELFKNVLDINDFIYQQFNEKEAFWLSLPYKWYINDCFNKFYCEDLDLLAC